jgi:hypothetical protein
LKLSKRGGVVRCGAVRAHEGYVTKWRCGECFLVRGWWKGTSLLVLFGVVVVAVDVECFTTQCSCKSSLLAACRQSRECQWSKTKVCGQLPTVPVVSSVQMGPWARRSKGSVIKSGGGQSSKAFKDNGVKEEKATVPRNT